MQKRNTFNYFYKEIKILLILKKEIKIFEKSQKSIYKLIFLQ